MPALFFNKDKSDSKIGFPAGTPYSVGGSVPSLSSQPRRWCADDSRQRSQSELLRNATIEPQAFAAIMMMR
jgi:hypothetical protein